jgi:hypothetical protein
MMARAFLIVLPVVLFVFGVGTVFQPKNAGEFIFAAHWLLIPFVPLYAVWIGVAFVLTRTTPKGDALAATVQQDIERRAVRVVPSEAIESAISEAVRQFLSGAKIAAQCPACADLLRVSHAQRPNVIVVACKCSKCKREFPGPREAG